MTKRLTSPKSMAIFSVLFALTVGLAPSIVRAQDTNAADKPGVNERYDDWVMSCAKPKAANKEVCEVRQMLFTSAQNRLVAALALSKLNGKYTLVGIVPLGARLQGEPTLTVNDTTTTDQGTYVQCLSSGCRILFTTPRSLLDAMGKGKKAHITIVRPNGKPLNIEFSLKGFDAAKRALDSRVS